MRNATLVLFALLLGGAPTASSAQQVNLNRQDFGACAGLPLSSFGGWLAAATGMICPQAPQTPGDNSSTSTASGVIDWTYLNGPTEFNGLYVTGYGTFYLELLDGDNLLYTTTFEVYGTNVLVNPGFYGDVSRIRIRRESGMGTYGLGEGNFSLSQSGNGPGGDGPGGNGPGGNGPGGSGPGGNGPGGNGPGGNGPGGNGPGGSGPGGNGPGGNGPGGSGPGGNGPGGNGPGGNGPGGNGPGGNDPSGPTGGGTGPGGQGTEETPGGPWDPNDPQDPLNKLVNEPNATPEPATLLLLASGLGGVGALRRYRQRKAARETAE